MAGQSGLPSRLKYLFMTEIERKFRNQVSFIFHVTSSSPNIGEATTKVQQKPVQVRKLEKVRDGIELINFK